MSYFWQIYAEKNQEFSLPAVVFHLSKRIIWATTIGQIATFRVQLRSVMQKTKTVVFDIISITYP